MTKMLEPLRTKKTDDHKSREAQDPHDQQPAGISLVQQQQSWPTEMAPIQERAPAHGLYCPQVSNPGAALSLVLAEPDAATRACSMGSLNFQKTSTSTPMMKR